ncbi:Gfo/Idh/MocA family protein [Nocardia transvalensis]|uniref:Gfo/Idh/MocA family protein n=1 Tax=Nocardia transvalensis TaxID=37333 RepID=UPI0018956AB6|nr:Gfo/Idh/MocA family oxidoreductase [Nocardia transvalensis]MBF6333389.1 Gfo/Idh/MocA family oxidoreductase [Nocardia transvalensis]
MKIALLGTGFGQAHAAVYARRSDVDEVVVFGRTPAKLAAFEEQFGFATTTDLDTLLTDPSVDLVDVCFPTPLHARTVLRALDAGKHVLTELPLADTLADANRVAEAAERSDRQVFVDMFERFIPANQALVDAVRDGIYGRLEGLTLWMATAPLWPGASLGLRTLPLEAMHSDLDIIVRTLGLPERLDVAAVARDADTAAVEAVMTFDGAIARSSVSALMPMPWGARGGYTATFDCGVLESTSTIGSDGTTEARVTAYTPDGVHQLDLPAADQYTAMIDHVLACLRGEADNRIGPDTVLDTLRLTLDIDRAVRAEA